MSSPGRDSQTEEMNSSQPGNASSSVPDVPSTSSAPTPTPSTPSLSVKVPSAFNLSSIPATLTLSGSLINGHPFSGHDENKGLVIYSGNAAECPRSFIIYLDLTGDMHGDKIKKQEEEEREKEEEREREGSEEQEEEQEDGKGEEDRPYQQWQPIRYCIASRDSRSERHLQHLRVDATRSVFPWQPSTPSPLDQTPPGSPAELPVEAPVEAPVELKSGWPVELRDSEDTDSSQPKTNNADLPSTAPSTPSTGAPPSITSTTPPNSEPKPSRPPARSTNILQTPMDLNNTPVGLYLCGNAMNGYPFSGRPPNDALELWYGPAAECPRSFNITLHLNHEDPNPEDYDCDEFWDVEESDDGRGMQHLVMRSVRPVWPWGPLTPVQSSTGSPVGSTSGSPVGSWDDYPDGSWDNPIGSPGGSRAASPVGHRPRPRARSI